MEDASCHPNSKLLMEAWKRICEGSVSEADIRAQDCHGLLSGLFVAQRASACDIVLRTVGEGVDRLFGRSLAGHDLLTVFAPRHRGLVACLALIVTEEEAPAVLRARGETLDGRLAFLEVVLAPIRGPDRVSGRILGLCQLLTPEGALSGRPLQPMHVVSLIPPAQRSREPVIRLVSSR